MTMSQESDGRPSAKDLLGHDFLDHCWEKFQGKKFSHTICRSLTILAKSFFLDQALCDL